MSRSLADSFAANDVSSCRKFTALSCVRWCARVRSGRGTRLAERQREDAKARLPIYDAYVARLEGSDEVEVRRRHIGFIVL
jgi:hypothetical protein